MSKYRTPLGVALGLTLTALSPIAAAKTACVLCIGPEARYLCHATAERPVSDKNAGLFCAARIAAEYGHESCGTQRSEADCNGVQVHYTLERGADSPSTNLASPNEPAHRDEDAKQNEPETLGEFVSDTMDASAKTAKKAGENIADATSKAGKATSDAVKGAGETIRDATKKTLRCLGSALNDC